MKEVASPAESLFYGTLAQAWTLIGNDPKLRQFKSEIDPRTGLSNEVLLARAIQQLQMGEQSQIIVCEGKARKKTPFATPYPTATKDSGKNLSTVWLNTESRLLNTVWGGTTPVSSTDVKQMLQAVIDAQVTIENWEEEGKPIATKQEVGG